MGRSQDGEVARHPSLSARAADVHGAIAPRKPCTAGNRGRVSVMMRVRGDAQGVSRKRSRRGQRRRRTHIPLGYFSRIFEFERRRSNI